MTTTLTDTETSVVAKAAGYSPEGYNMRHDLAPAVERIVAARVVEAVDRERAAWVAKVEALADYLTRKVGEVEPPIGTRVAIRSFKGAVGTIVGPDGYPRGSALAVRMDAPYPSGFDDGYVCVSTDECAVVALPSADDVEAKP